MLVQNSINYNNAQKYSYLEKPQYFVWKKPQEIQTIQRVADLFSAK